MKGGEKANCTALNCTAKDAKGRKGKSKPHPGETEKTKVKGLTGETFREEQRSAEEITGQNRRFSAYGWCLLRFPLATREAAFNQQ